MFLEVVKFGDGYAIEIRDSATKITIYYMIICSLQSAGLIQEAPNIPTLPLRGTEMDDFESECFTIIDEHIGTKLRWLMLCSDMDIIPEGESAEQFQELSQKVFGTTFSSELNSSKAANFDSALRTNILNKVGIPLKFRTWMVDRETRRVFCLHFQFAGHIFKTTLLAGVMIKHKSFRPQYREASYCTEQLTKGLEETKKNESTHDKILRRLREVMPKEINGTVDVLESKEIEVTEFIVKDAKMWCGDPCFRGIWLAQQLNVWFNTPITEQCWFRPNSRDAFLFNIGILDDMITPNTRHDVDRWVALPAPSQQNQVWRYPRGDIVCGTPGGIVGIGHFLPVFDESWNDNHCIAEVRLFRLYKTQYPFVYSLMPNDDKQVRTFKNQLKHSTELNPSLAEKGKEKINQRKKKPNLNDERFTPLIATLPTLECERYVKGIFHQNPKHRYRLFYCARYDNKETLIQKWVPITPLD
jgi:hypothetical protein